MTLELARDVRHLAQRARRGGGRAAGRSRAAASEATARRRRSTATTRRPSPRSPTSRSTPTRSATIRSRSRRSWSGCRSARVRCAGGVRHGAARPAGQARSAGPCTSCSACAVPARRRRGRSGSAIPTTWRGVRREGRSRASSRLKLKLGAGDGLDVERVRAVRERDRAADAGRRERGLGAADEALDNLRELAQFDVQYCEQPLAADAMLGNEQLKRESPIPIYVDENCHTLADVAECARSSRTASTSSSRSPAAFARGCAWCTPRARSASAGCSAAWSSRASAIAAGAHIASLFDHIDLDGNILIDARPVSRASSSSTACSCRPSCPASASLLHERTLPDPRRGLQRRPALRQDGARRAPLPTRRRRRDPRLDA